MTSVLQGSKAKNVFKGSVEKCGVGVADELRDLRNILVGYFQELTSLFDSDLLKIVTEIHTSLASKYFAYIGKGEIDVLAYIRKANGLVVVARNVFLDIPCDVVHLGVLLRGFVSHKIDDSRHKKISYYILVALSLVVILVKHFLGEIVHSVVNVVVDVLGGGAAVFCISELYEIVVENFLKGFGA